MCAYYRYVASHAHIIGMSLHVHILSVLHFACIYYQCITLCAHTICMSLHVHILSVCHFICTYMNVVFKLSLHSTLSMFVVLYCLLSRHKGTCTLERYVKSLQMRSINVSCR
jgi:hypothetical protein